MTTWATREAVESAATSWSADQIECRTYAHRWMGRTVRHRPGQYEVEQICDRCLNVRRQNIDERGYPLGPWNMNYRQGYLMEQGTGRVGADGKAALRLATFQHVNVIEVGDEET